MPTLSLTRNTWINDTLRLGIIFLVFYFFFLGSFPLFIPDEGRYSEVAREMLATGDFVTPRVNGVVFLDKPVLYYWLQAASFHLLGVNEWAVRFFPALFAVIGCLATYVFGRHLFDRRTGIIASIILATTPLYFGAGHYANLDLEVAVLISITLLLFISAIDASDKTRPWFLAAMYGVCGLAMLTKGLIAVAFPGMIGLIWLVLTKQLTKLKQLRLLLGVAIFLAVVLPWYILAQKANPAFFQYFFVQQQLNRFISGAAFNNAVPVWFYAPVVLVGFLPWTLFCYAAIRHKEPLSNTRLYLMIWVSVVFVFFSIPHSKAVSYILPIFPPLALLVGQYISSRWEAINKITRASFKLATIVTTVFLLGVVLSAKQLNMTTSKPLVATLTPLLQPGDEVIHYYKFYQDVPLYLQKRVTLVANWQDPSIVERDNWVRELWYGMPFQDTSEWLINDNEFWKRFESNRRVFVFLNDNYFNQFKSRAKRYYILGTFNDIILLSNKPTMLSLRHLQS